MSWLDRVLGRETAKKTIEAPLPFASRRALIGGRLTAGAESSGLTSRLGYVLGVPESPEGQWRRLNLDAQTLEVMPTSELMMMLADLSPDVSKTLWDWVRFCNPGWTCTVLQVGSETPHAAGQALIDDFLKRIGGPYLYSEMGADIIIGMMFSTMFLRGAALIELVLDQRGRVPLNLAIPDPVSVRLKRTFDERLGDGFVIGQQQNGKWVTFDRPTIAYVPVDPILPLPYGRPVAGSALNTVIFLVAILNDLRRVIQQQGWPRLDLPVDFEKLRALMPGDTDDPAEIQAWADQVIREIETVYASLEPEDAYIHSDAITVNRPVGAVDTGSLGAIETIIRALERRVVRALKTQPMLMGINEATTETHAVQQWEIHVAGIRSIQHRLETALDHLLGLALQAQGIQATVRFKFAELRASEMERYARTEAAQIANEIAKRDQGWISNDAASIAITGHPAVAEYVPGTIEELDAEEPDDEEPAPERRRMASTRVLITPDGAEDGPLPLPDVVTLSDAEIDRAFDAWDDDMPDCAGLLDARVVEQESAARAVRGATNNPWEYIKATKTYRDTTTGLVIDENRMRELRDRFIEVNRAWFRENADRLTSGEIDLQRWEREMRDRLKIIHCDQYVLGRGARGSMTQSDWGKVGHELRDQYGFLNDFAKDIASGGMSPATIASRSALYVESGTVSYERGRAAAYGGLKLPNFPGDGTTQCMVNCKCSWRIEETEDAWNCYWTLGKADHCEDCVSRSQTWAPYTYPKRQAI